jgi:hypothetical protein
MQDRGFAFYGMNVRRLPKLLVVVAKVAKASNNFPICNLFGYRVFKVKGCETIIQTTAQRHT